MTTKHAATPAAKASGAVSPEASSPMPSSGPHSTAKSKEVPRRISYAWKDLMAYGTEADPNWCANWICRRQVSKMVYVLKQVSGYVHSGEILAVMGPSGSGKTTLLNFLALRRPPGLTKEGSILLNGKEATRRKLSAISKYVMQDDLFIERLTVWEHLHFQAQLRKKGGGSMTHVVEDVLEEFGLQSCAKVRIGDPRGVNSKGISGGEMKRLALATELLSNPLLLIVDEPTSGLDSSTALNLMKTLSKLAKKGMAIVLTIHQPSSQIFSLLRRIMVLADGRVAYQGNVADARHFFKRIGHPCPEHYNPVDHYVKMVAVLPDEEKKTEARRDQVCAAYIKSPERKKFLSQLDRVAEGKGIHFKALDEMRLYQASRCVQFTVLFKRNIISLIRNNMLLRVRTAVALINGVILGSLYLQQGTDVKGIQNMSSALFVLAANVTFANNYSVITEYCSELPLMMREYANGLYSVDAYFLSRQISDTPIYLLNSVIFLTIFYWMVGLNPDAERFLVCLGVTLLLTLVVLGFGQMLSCMAPNVFVALALAPPLMTPFLLFGGFLLNKKTTPEWIGWAKYLTWFHYSNELYMINQWDGLPLQICPRAKGKHLTECTQKYIYDFQDIDKDGWLFSIVMLAVQIAVFRLVALAVLLLKATQLSKRA